MAVTVVLSEIQRDTLARLCDTFAPSISRDDDPTGFWARAASDLGIPDAIEQALGTLPEQQLDGLRMGTDPHTSVAGPCGELHDVHGVWIGDASASPRPRGRTRWPR